MFNELQRTIEKTRQVVWDALKDYGRIEWKWTLPDLEKALDMAYQNVLYEFNSTLGSKVLLGPGIT